MNKKTKTSSPTPRGKAPKEALVEDTEGEEFEDDDEIEEEVEEVSARDFSFFRIKTDALFDEKDVFEIDLPKFSLKGNQLPCIDEKSNFAIAFLIGKDNSDLGSRVYRTIKKGIKVFQILWLNEKGEVSSVWDLSKTMIVSVDFGALKTVNTPEPKLMQCEFSYEYMTIDGEAIS